MATRTQFAGNVVQVMVLRGDGSPVGAVVQVIGYLSPVIVEIDGDVHFGASNIQHRLCRPLHEIRSNSLGDSKYDCRSSVRPFLYGSEA